MLHRWGAAPAMPAAAVPTLALDGLAAYRAQWRALAMPSPLQRQA